MEMNNKELVEREQTTEPNDVAVKIETAHEQNEQNAEKMELIEQKSPNSILVPLKKECTQPKGKNGKYIKRKKWSRPANFFKRKSVDPSSPTTEIESTEPAEPPEEWKPSRLRQNGRELVLNRIKAVSEDILTLKSDKAWLALAKRCTSKRLSQLNDCSIKVEDGLHEKKVTGNKRRKEEKLHNPAENRCSRRVRRLANETEEQRYIRIERVKMAQLKRRVMETDEEKAERLERQRIAEVRRRATETEEQRFIRIERVKMARLKRRVMETDEEKARRLERQRRAQQIRNLRKKSRIAVEQQQKMIDEYNKLDTDDHITDSIHIVNEVLQESESAIHDGEVESSDVSTSNVEIGNLTPENSLESAERLSQQNDFLEFSVVKVEEEQQQVFELLQESESAIHDGEVESSDASTSNVEIGNLTPENSLESAKRLSQQNGFSEFTVVKVEEEQQQLFELLQDPESVVHGEEVESSDTSTLNVEISYLTTENSLDSAERLSQQINFLEFTVVKVEEQQELDMDVTTEYCGPIEEGRRHHRSVSKAKSAKTTQQRSKRLQRIRNENTIRLKKKTVAEKRARRKMSYIHRRFAETDEERHDRLERIRMAKTKLRETETEEEKRARLERYRAYRLKQQETETKEQREARLERMRIVGKFHYLRKKELRAAGGDYANGRKRNQRNKKNSTRRLNTGNDNSSTTCDVEIR